MFSVTHYTDFAKAFFILEMAWGLTVHTQI